MFLNCVSLFKFATSPIPCLKLIFLKKFFMCEPPCKYAKSRGSRGSRGSFSWIIILGQARRSNSKVILVGQTGGSNWWVVLVGQTCGSFLVIHYRWSFLCLELLDTLRSQNCQTILIRLWILVTFSEISNIYNLLYAFLFFLYSNLFLFSSRLLELYPP